MANTPNLKKLYQDEVAPALMQKFAGAYDAGL